MVSIFRNNLPEFRICPAIKWAYNSIIPLGKFSQQSPASMLNNKYVFTVNTFAYSLITQIAVYKLLILLLASKLNSQHNLISSGQRFNQIYL